MAISGNAKYTAQVREMRSAATEIRNKASEYRDATGSAMKACDTLASQWEGDAQVAFVTEQGEAKRWYEQMYELILNYAKALEEAARTYEDADRAAERAIR